MEWLGNKKVDEIQYRQMWSDVHKNPNFNMKSGL